MRNIITFKYFVQKQGEINYFLGGGGGGSVRATEMLCSYYPSTRKPIARVKLSQLPMRNTDFFRKAAQCSTMSANRIGLPTYLPTRLYVKVISSFEARDRWRKPLGSSPNSSV